jgi:hypothetical protein
MENDCLFRKLQRTFYARWILILIAMEAVSKALIEGGKMELFGQLWLKLNRAQSSAFDAFTTSSGHAHVRFTFCHLNVNVAVLYRLRCATQVKLE